MTIHQTTGVVPVDAYLRGMERLATVAERLREDFGRVFAEPPPPSIRKSCERMIEDLIAVVDACDDDPDLEDGGDDEPSLGFGVHRVGMGEHDIETARNECLGEDREADDYDNEPSLGAIERHPDPDYSPDRRDQSGTQVAWADSPSNELEDEHDGRESLSGDGTDREHDLDCDEGDSDAMGGAGGVDDEQSLGSFDRMTNQEHAWSIRAGGAWWAGQDVEADPAEGHF